MVRLLWWWLRSGMFRLWWWLRGVGVSDYRALCSRCGRTGQTHWARGCVRFRGNLFTEGGDKWQKLRPKSRL